MSAIRRASLDGDRPEADEGPGMSEGTARAFVLRTSLQPIRMRPVEAPSADEVEPSWRRAEEELQSVGLPPPFWALRLGRRPGAGALPARPSREVASRRVLDFRHRRRIGAIAAMKAGAASVLASDLDPSAPRRALNAQANAVAVGSRTRICWRPRRPTRGPSWRATSGTRSRSPSGERLAEARTGAAVRVLLGDRAQLFPDAGAWCAAQRGVPTTRELRTRRSSARSLDLPGLKR